MTTIFRRACTACCWLVVVVILASPLLYIAMLNWMGPSTEYHHPEIATAILKEDGKRYVYVGDEFYVWIYVVRHKINGNCLFDIERFAEATEGQNAGVPRLISKETLQFVGQNEMRRTRWPQTTRLIIGYEIDETGSRIGPLLPEDAEQQGFDFYVVGRYYCNVLDYVFPRHIQGGSKPNETPRVHAILKRTKP